MTWSYCNLSNLFDSLTLVHRPCVKYPVYVSWLESDYDFWEICDNDVRKHTKSRRTVIPVEEYYHNASCSFRWLLTTKQTLTHLILLMFFFRRTSDVMCLWAHIHSGAPVNLILSSRNISSHITSHTLYKCVSKPYYVYLRVYAVNNRFR